MSTQAPAGTSSPAAPPPEAPTAEPKEAKQIKPIKKGLPGLVSMKDDPQDEALKRFKAEKAASAAKEAKAQTAHLDPAITDKPSKSSEAAALPQATDAATQADTDKAALEATPDPATQAEPAASPEHIERLNYLNKLLGVKFESLEKGEHSLKTLHGMHKALLRRAEEAERKAEGWYKAHESLKSQKALDAVESTGQSKLPTQGQPASTAAAKASDDVVKALLEEAVNPNTFSEVWDRSGDKTAVLWGLSKLAELLEKRVTASLDSRFKPVEEQTQQTQEVKRIVDTFQGVATLTDPASGDYLYPEFADPQFLNASIYIWKEMQMNPEVAYSHKGVHAAYLATRDYFSRAGIQIAGAQTPTPAKPNAVTAAGIDKIAAAAADGLNGKLKANPGVLSATVVPPMRPSAPLSVEQEIRRRILDAEPVHPKLGFAVTRR